MALDAEFLETLACPWCVTRPLQHRQTLLAGTLELQGTLAEPVALRCKDCARSYAFRDGLPDLVLERATVSATPK